MNLVANVICWWLLAQASGGDRAPGDLGAFQPRAVPKRAAQATPIEIGDGGGEPAAHGSDAAPGQHQKEAGGDIPDNHPAGPSDPAGGMSPVDRPHQKLRPPELLAEALTTPREGAVIGKPLTLLTALSRTADRQQQLKITQSYWRLSTAAGRLPLGARPSATNCATIRKNIPTHPARSARGRRPGPTCATCNWS